jgi:excisionase family DNA binding protein
MTVMLERGPVLAPETDTPEIRELAEVVQQDTHALSEVVGPRGQRLHLPDSVRQLLGALIVELAKGNAVSIVSRGREITTQEAADLLNVSRPYLVKLVDAGQLPCRRVGNRRRVPLEAVLAYRARELQRQEALLSNLTQEAQEMGFYD